MVANPKDFPRHYYTLDEYFALEKVEDGRYEYWDGDIVSMAGGSLEHAVIGGNVFVSLTTQLKGRNCRPFNAELAIKTPKALPYRYPDASVVCGEVQREKIEGIDVLLNPILVVEVLSPRTESRDRNEKRKAYQALPSMREYLLLAQDKPQAIHYVKKGDLWVRTAHDGLATELVLESIACQLLLSDVYEGVIFN